MKHIAIYKYRSTSKKCHIFDTDTTSTANSFRNVLDLCGKGDNFYFVTSFKIFELPSIERIERALSIINCTLCKKCKLVYIMKLLEI